MVYNLHEQTIVRNGFGIVTDRKVTYPSRKGKQDIPVEHIISVSYNIKSGVAVGLFCLVLGIVVLCLQTTPAYIMGALLMGAGLMQLRSAPVVIISTAGGNKITVQGKPGQKQEAEAFASALKRQLRK